MFWRSPIGIPQRRCRSTVTPASVPKAKRALFSVSCTDPKNCLDQIASHADKKGITIVVEPTAAATNLIETADAAMELMRSVARDNVKVMFDTFHALYRGNDTKVRKLSGSRSCGDARAFSNLS
jgi:sugar phosphate isomerase/epimerase